MNNLSNEMMENVVVIMSSYNGEEYISEQIESVLNQKDVNVKLMIRDDGSQDGTCQVVRSLQKSNDNLFLVEGDNVGCKRSFYIASQSSFSEFKEVEYFAFCDQDDVWLDSKLKIAVSKLKSHESDRPMLYYCRPTVVDSNLELLSWIWPHNNRNTFGEACLIQPSAGCTMVFNRKALELFLKAQPEVMSLHDSWMTKVVSACGGTIYEDNDSYILYRQHQGNVVGVQTSFIEEIKRRVRSLTAERNKRSSLLVNFYEIYEWELTFENRKLITLAISYRKKLSAKLRILFSKNFRSNRLSSNIGFCISVLLNRY